MQQILMSVLWRSFASWALLLCALQRPVVVLSVLMLPVLHFLAQAFQGVESEGKTGELQIGELHVGEAQTLSSLEAAWKERLRKTLPPDSASVMLLAALAREYTLRNPILAEEYAKQAISELAASQHFRSYPILRVYTTVCLVAAYMSRGDNMRASLEIQRILPEAEHLKNSAAKNSATKNSAPQSYTVYATTPAQLSKNVLLAELYLFQASILFDNAKRTDALALYNKAFQEAGQSNDTLLIVKALCGMAGVEAFLGRYADYNAHTHRAMAYATKPTTAATPTRSQNAAMARIHLAQAFYHTRISAFRLAIESGLAALKFYEQKGWRTLEAEALNVMIFALRFQFERAVSADAEAQFERYLERALRLFREFGNKRGLLMVYLETGLKFENQKRYDSALVYDQKLLALAHELESQYDIIAGTTNVGILLWRTGKPDSALAYLYQGLRLAEESQSVRMMIVPSVRIASILRQDKRQPALALKYVQRGLHLADSLKNVSRKQYALMELAAVYDSLRQYEYAYRALSEAYTLRDSVFSNESSEKVAQLQIEYETERKDSEILLLQKNQELQVSIAARQQVIQYWLISTLIAALGISAWFWWLYYHKERANAEIAHQKALLEEQTNTIQSSNFELHAQNEQLSELNREKTEIMGIVSHDLKNPISAVRGFGDLIANGTLTHEEVLSVAQQIMRTSERMLELVKNLLDLNQIESGAKEFRFVVFDITPLVETIIAQYQTQAALKRITIDFAAESSATSVFADEQAMVQVLDNLLSNAIKYSPHGKSVSVRVRHLSLTSGHSSDESNNQSPNVPMTNNQSTNDYLRVEVEDEGEGISNDDMKKLFGKFVRLKARPTGGEHSTGLGLSIVKKMVEAMNGRVWCESDFGKGARFIVELPATKAVS